MPLSREAVVEHLKKILPAERVITDEQVLKERSIDNFRKLQSIFRCSRWRFPPRWPWCTALPRLPQCWPSPTSTG